MKTNAKRFAILAALSLSFLAVSSIAQIGDPDEQPKADSRVRKALDQTSLKYKVDSDGDFRLELPLEDNRTHLVFVSSATETYAEMEVREVWAIGLVSKTGFPRARLEMLLKKNGEYKLGAWQLTQNGERAIFSVVVSARANSDTLDSVVHFVAEVADDLEKEVLGTDDY